MTTNIQLSVNLTPKLRLKRALKEAGIENPASVTHLTISGTLTKSDFRFFSEKMAKTLQSLDLSNASRFGKEFLSNCAALTSIIIPDSRRKFKSEDLPFLPALTHITATPKNPVYTSEEGVLFNKIKSALICYPAGRQGDYVIPRSVGIIEEYAFANCTGLSAVTIPDSVVKIRSYAFMNCTGLKSVIIPDSVTVIDDKAFEGCIGLTSIYIPKSVVRFRKPGRYLLSLTHITVHPDNPIYSDENGILFFADKGVLLRYPPGRQGDYYVIPDSVGIIEAFAFADCTGLSAVTVPDGIIIFHRAFAGCTGLTAITFPDSRGIIDDLNFELVDNLCGVFDTEIW